MNPTLDGIVEQALANEEAADNAVQEEVKDVEQVDAEEQTSKEQEETSEEKATEETSEDEASEAEESPEQGEEYSADDIVYDEEEQSAEEVVKEPEAVAGLNPEQSYIFNNLPDISVRGADGKAYTIKVPSQLPEDFEFANKREEVIFNQNVAAQELNARDLQTRFRADEQARQGNQFQETLNASIRDDVAELQREGIFPKFKTPIDSPKFEQDPAAVEMQAVLDLMEERNAQYLAASQKGAAFRFIGFKEAYDIYTAQQARASKNGRINAEDSARKTIAKKSSSSSGIREDSIVKPSVRPGTTTRDLLAEIEAMDF